MQITLKVWLGVILTKALRKVNKKRTGDRMDLPKSRWEEIAAELNFIRF